MTTHYLAYGSNLHPLRLQERVPSALPLALVHMPGQQLTFHKQSTDHSGKCNIFEKKEATSYSVLYEIDDNEIHLLHEAEGFGKGYHRALTKIQFNDTVLHPFLYIADNSHLNASLVPYDWYKELVVVGALHHQFPPEYVANLQSVQCIADPDKNRARKKEALIIKLKQAQPATSNLPWIHHKEPIIEDLSLDPSPDQS